MTSKIEADPRIDPRIKAALGAFPTRSRDDAESREAMLAEANTPEALAATAALRASMASGPRRASSSRRQTATRSRSC